jgi:FlaA1/EpsC-like NDP-sugar epimerase
MGGEKNGWRGETRRMRGGIAPAVIDGLVVIVAYSTALGLRLLDPLVSDASSYWSDLLRFLPVIIVVHVAANAIFGVYRHEWGHASVTEASRLAIANGAAMIVIVSLGWIARHSLELLVPYLTLVVGCLFTVLLTGLLRLRSFLSPFRRTSETPRGP